MTEDEAIKLLEEARPIFEMADEQQWFDLENNLKYGQYDLLDNIHRVWYAG